MDIQQVIDALKEQRVRLDRASAVLEGSSRGSSVVAEQYRVVLEESARHISLGGAPEQPQRSLEDGRGVKTKQASGSSGAAKKK